MTTASAVHLSQHSLFTVSNSGVVDTDVILSCPTTEIIMVEDSVICDIEGATVSHLVANDTNK